MFFDEIASLIGDVLVKIHLRQSDCPLWVKASYYNQPLLMDKLA